jgi:hypothetical protein
LKTLVLSLIFWVMVLVLSSCQSTPYAPPSTPAIVQSVKIEVSNFHGRPDVYADVKGRLSSNAAQLVDVKQSRGKGNLLLIQVNEQTPLGGTGTNKVPYPPFQTRVPIEVLGLYPGQVYLVDVNGCRTQFQMPTPETGVDESDEFFSATTATGLELPGY